MAINSNLRSNNATVQIGTGILIIIMIVSGLTYFLSTSGVIGQKRVVSRIGTEAIYQSDIDNELKSYDQNKTNGARVALLKIQNDSRILQEAASLKLIELDSSYFNSPTKNYAKRIEMLKKVPLVYDQSQSGVDGYLFTMWFFNNARPGSLGYEKGQKEAEKRIKEAKSQIDDQKKTPDEMLKILKADKSLLSIDPNYENNIGFRFAAKTKGDPTYDKAFNEIIWNTAPGKTSPIQQLNDINPVTNKPIPALYAFAYITKKSNNITGLSYNDWVKSLESKYEIK